MEAYYKVLICVSSLSIYFFKTQLEIFSLNRGKESNNLPTEVHGILIKTTGQTVNIAGPFGLQITCNKQLFFCDFKVPGIFHNKTLGKS